MRTFFFMRALSVVTIKIFSVQVSAVTTQVISSYTFRNVPNMFILFKLEKLYWPHSVLFAPSSMLHPS